MGALWGILLAIGTMAPALLVVGSAWLVARMARRLREHVPASRPPWQWVVGHLALITIVEGGSTLVLGYLAPGFMVLIPGGLAALSMLIAPVYLYHHVHKAAPHHPTAKVHGDHIVGGRSDAAGRRRWGEALLMVLTGIVLPWLTGLGVKIYLDSRGRPTLPVSDFLDPRALPVLLIQTVTLWAFPFLILASAVVVPWRVGFAKHPRGRESILPIRLAYVGGVLAQITLFVGIFWEFDSIMLIVPLGLYLLPPMVIGYLIGWWIVVRQVRIRS
jgi:hypothetical protein